MTTNRGSRLFRAVATACTCALVPSAWGPETILQAQAGNGVEAVVRELGVGADVVVSLKYGDDLRGLIRDIHPDGFELELERDGQRRRPAFKDVRKVTLAHMRYKTGGETDIAAVRRILTVLGPGKYVLVKTDDGRKIRGRVREIETSHFALQPDTSPTPTVVEYEQILEIRPKPLSTGTKAAIITAVSAGGGALGALLIYVAAVCANEGC
jgi:hypothetical protein